VSEVGAWEFVSEDGKDVLVSAVMLEVHGNMTANYIRLKGLKEGAMYRDKASGRIYPANALMQVGIPLPIEMGEYHAYRIHFELV
jgi:alpha-galactosidase